MKNIKHGFYPSVKKGQDLGYFGHIKAYDNGRLIFQETFWNLHRLTRQDAMLDAIGSCEEMGRSNIAA